MSQRRFISAGAVFAWPHDNQPLQEARDRHVVTGNPQPVKSPWGPALSFDGVADYVTLGAAWEDQLRFDAGTDDFTAAAWVRRGVVEQCSLFSKEDASDDGWRWLLWEDGTAWFSIQDTDAPSATGAIPAGNSWNSVIAVVDRDTSIQHYINGQPSGSPTAIAGPVMATTVAPRIGARAYDADYKYDGELAGLLVFPRILAPAECLGLATGDAF